MRAVRRGAGRGGSGRAATPPPDARRWLCIGLPLCLPRIVAVAAGYALVRALRLVEVHAVRLEAGHALGAPVGRRERLSWLAFCIAVQ
jgi:hypothetical protein